MRNRDRVIKQPALRVGLVLFLLGFCLAGVVLPVSAQARVDFSEISVDYVFGEQVIFQAKVLPAATVKEVYLFIQPAGEATRLEVVSFNSSGTIQLIYDIAKHPLRPFATTAYWFRAVTTAGVKFESAKNSFVYQDNREPWQSLIEGPLEVNWLQGDMFFGQTALNIARTGMRSAYNILPNGDVAPMKIFIYSSAAKLQETLNLSSTPWVVGNANPDLGVVLVSIPPGADQQVEMERQIPHEIMHLILYQNAKDSYPEIPIWMNEGLASIVETNPNFDYQRALKKAVKDNSLLPISALCAAFPQDASGAFLSYAESASFVKFLQTKYGNKALADLVARYKNGLSCEDGVQATTGSSLEQLSYRWHQESLGMDASLLAAQNLSPYVLIIALLLVIPLVTIGVFRQWNQA